MNRQNNRICLFIRVSTEKQDYDRQILELSNYCSSNNYVIAKTIATKITGSKLNNQRPDLVELFEAAQRKEFEKVLVTEISRIGRNAKEIRKTIDFLHTKNITIVFKNLGVESRDVYGNENFVTNIIIAIYSELAQEEKRILVERIKSGLESAKAKGKQLGRPEGTTEDDAKLLKKYSRLVIDLKNGLSLRKSMKIHEVSKGTVIKLKRLI